MSKSNTGPPKCSVCGGYHRLGAPHVWAEPVKPKEIVESVHKPKLKVIKRPSSVHKKSKVCVHKEEKQDSVYTIRQVGVRQLRNAIAKELTDLPFDIVKRGKVIARVIEQ